jgi:hypothetical protein
MNSFPLTPTDLPRVHLHCRSFINRDNMRCPSNLGSSCPEKTFSRVKGKTRKYTSILLYVLCCFVFCVTFGLSRDFSYGGSKQCGNWLICKFMQAYVGEIWTLNLDVTFGSVNHWSSKRGIKASPKPRIAGKGCFLWDCRFTAVRYSSAKGRRYLLGCPLCQLEPTESSMDDPIRTRQQVELGFCML